MSKKHKCNDCGEMFSYKYELVAHVNRKCKPIDYKFGRPTSYRKEYIEMMMEHFDQPLYILKKKQIASGGRKVEIEEEKPNSMPTFESFAVSIGVIHETLKNWTERDPDFFEAYKACKDIQKKFIIEHGMMGNYNPGFAKFIAVNVTDLKDRVTHEVEDTRIVVELPSDKAAKL